MHIYKLIKKSSNMSAVSHNVGASFCKLIKIRLYWTTAILKPVSVGEVLVMIQPPAERHVVF